MAEAVVAPAPLRPTPEVEYVFEAHNTSIPDIREYVREIWERRRFVVEMARSEIRGSRASTVMGELWAVADPLFQASIYLFLIMVIRGGAGGDVTPYLTRVVSGIFLFSVTSSALSKGGRAIIRGKGLLLNSTFPRALLPLTAIYQSVLEFIPGMAVYAVIHLLIGAPLALSLFLLPLLFVIQLTLSTGLAFLFSTLTVYVRDMSNLLEYLTRVLMFSTPILWEVDQLPGSVQSILLVVNPLFGLFASYQAAILGGSPNPLHLLVAVSWAAVLLVAGSRLFMRNERSFALFL